MGGSHGPAQQQEDGTRRQQHAGGNGSQVSPHQASTHHCQANRESSHPHRGAAASGEDSGQDHQMLGAAEQPQNVHPLCSRQPQPRHQSHGSHDWGCECRWQHQHQCGHASDRGQEAAAAGAAAAGVRQDRRAAGGCRRRATAQAAQRGQGPRARQHRWEGKRSHAARGGPRQPQTAVPRTETSRRPARGTSSGSTAWSKCSPMSNSDTLGCRTARCPLQGRDGACLLRDGAAAEGGQLPTPRGRGPQNGPALHGGAKQAPPC